MIVRNSQVSDIESILAVKREPHVAKMQYPVNQTAYASFLSKVLAGDNTTGGVTTQFSSLEEDRTIIGYVRHDHYSVHGTKMVECSFNLAYAFWGQGVMKSALKQWINDWIGKDGVQCIFAEHFRANARCANLLTRLRFDYQPISMVERVNTLLQQGCLRWIIRRRLDAANWNTKLTV